MIKWVKKWCEIQNTRFHESMLVMTFYFFSFEVYSKGFRKLAIQMVMKTIFIW